MKYLLGYLEGIPDAPNLSDPGFQQLLHDVQAGKSQAKASEAFYENLEKILNELKSTPDSSAFHKPVSKREAPNYYDIITKPMDFTTMLRNVKSQRYKTKADFAADLDLIWDNCLLYNTQDNHPLRAQARLMKQKADHHLTFLAERTEKPSTFLQSLSSRRVSGTPAATAPEASQQPTADGAAGAEEDAAGESDDAAGEQEQDFQEGAKRATTEQPQEDGRAASQLPGSLAGRDRRDTSVLTNGHVVNGQASSSRQSPPPFRPKLQTSLDSAPALTRTPHSTTHFQPFSLNQPGPSFSDKGKAKEVLQPYIPPSWYLPGETEESRLEGSWWTYVAKDENYMAALPAVPQMLSPADSRPLPKRRGKCRPRQTKQSRPGGSPESSSTTLVDHDHPPTPKSLPSLVATKPVNLTNVIHRSADHLADIRKSVGKIHEFQKAEHEGYLIPPPKPHIEREEKRVARQEWNERKRRRKEDRAEARKRAKVGGEVGEREAALSVRHATASMLAQAGFEGSTDVALDLMSRVVMDRMTNLGRTMRLLIDGFSHKMSSEEMVLHALYENGGLGPGDIETHVKDEVEREESKIRDMSRRMRQAYKEVTTAPIIEDDMMFADNGEMLLDGNFADELGEDFLGLRNLGVAQEHGMQSLTVPSSVFYGRRKRQQELANAGQKEEGPDYPPPPPLLPLINPTSHSLPPALLHAFIAARLENGLGLTDDGFDATHSQIGPLGQIIVKNPPAPKKRPEVQKKPKPVKVIVPGPGKGNWVRPPKEERDRRAAEKKASMVKPNGIANGNATVIANGNGNGNASEEDAEGEEE